MSIKVTERVWLNSTACGAELLVLLAMAEHSDDEAITYVGVRRIARYARVDERTARRALRKLEAAGELALVSPANDARRSATYRITVKKGGELPPIVRRRKGGKMPPGGGQHAPVVGASCPPEGGKLPPEPLRGTVIEPSGEPAPLCGASEQAVLDGELFPPEAPIENKHTNGSTIRSVIFGAGLDYLRRKYPDRGATALRKVLGRWCRSPNNPDPKRRGFGEEATAAALLASQRDDDVDPISRITWRLQNHDHGNDSAGREKLGPSGRRARAFLAAMADE